MFYSNVLEVSIGIIFTFLTVSLICGTLTETVATILSWRAKTLLDGIKKLVNDDNFTGLAKELYQTSLVHPLGAGGGQVTGGRSGKPAYVDPKNFVQALLDTVAVGKTTVADIKAAVESNSLIANDPQLKQLFKNLLTQAGNDVEKLKQDLGVWFDAAMDRVSGTYKRWAQLFCFIFGLIVAIGLNIDTVRVANVLWQHPDYARAITMPASDTTATSILNEYKKLKFPIGWTEESLDAMQKDGLISWLCPWSAQWANQRSAYWLQLVGWLITALSTLFGASFWFDALANLIKLRGNGPAPKPTPPPTTAVQAAPSKP